MNKVVLYTVHKDKLIKGTGHSRRIFNPWTGKYVSTTMLSRVLRSLGYSIQDYYDRWFLNITVKSDRPKCPECNKELPFGRSLVENYRYEFCSHKCAVRYRIKNADLYPEFVNSLLPERSKLSDEDHFKFHSYKDYARTYKYSNDIGYVYIVRLDKFTKVGISNTYYGLQDRLRKVRYSGTILEQLIVKGDGKEMARLEYEIKIKFKDHLIYDRYTSGWTEHFSPNQYDNIIKFINDWTDHPINV